MNKFCEIKNVAENEFSLYVYGEIVGDKTDSLFPSQSDIDINDFKKALAEIPNGAKLNMYINSPGGSVFACSTMMSMLQRTKDRGVEIDAYIDGIGASCASWLPMIADNIFIYKNSVMMIHKPMTVSFGNVNDLKKDIEVLDKLENGVIIPFYESKMKCSLEKLKEMIDAETWLTADEIQEYFNVTLIDEAKDVKNIKSDLFNTYKNTPKEFKQVEKPAENMADTSSQQEKIKEEEQKNIDYSYYKNILKELGV